MLVLDWMTSGRAARGERWAFTRYQSRCEIRSGAREIFWDALWLDPGDGPLAAPQRMGAVDALAMVVLTGPRLRAGVSALLDWVAAQPLDAEAAVCFAASPIHGGVVLRAASPSTERLAHWLKDRLHFIADLLGADPWTRKW